MSHTPGPWDVHAIKESGGPMTFEIVEHDTAIPYVATVRLSSHARLIAAAPDLLETLRAMTDDAESWLDYAIANDRIVKGDARRYRDRIVTARAALAKAGV